jgi:hypothetical protein
VGVTRHARSWWRSLSPPAKAGVAALVCVVLAGLVYVTVSLALIGLATLGIGETCRPGC